jgi:hypothetical protein
MILQIGYVTSKFNAPSGMSKYIHKHLKKCITKEEREEHPRPDVELNCSVMSLKCMMDIHHTVDNIIVLIQINH